MRRIVSGPLAALVVLATVPLPAAAATRVVQEPDPAEEEEDDLVIVDDEMEGGGEEPAPEGETPEEDGGGEEIDLFGDDTSTEPTDEGGPARPGEQDKDSEEKQIQAEKGLITVIQRQRMLKKGRFELQPQVGITVNDPYVRHYTLGLDFNYWFHNRMAIGLTGTGLIGARTPRYDNIRFQEGLLLTANQSLWQASLNFTYNPFYGKIAIFNRALLHWEGSAMIGAGATQTRVIPRYQSLHEPFSTVTGGGHVTLMGRFYGPKLDWLSVDFGVRTWIYADKYEPINRGPDDDATGLGDDPTLDDPSAAKDASSFEAAFNVTFFLGVSFFFPTSFDYKTPR